MKVCNFCGKSEEEVKLMVTSRKADICGECILVCIGVLLEQLQKESKVLEGGKARWLRSIRKSW